MRASACRHTAAQAQPARVSPGRRSASRGNPPGRRGSRCAGHPCRWGKTATSFRQAARRPCGHGRRLGTAAHRHATTSLSGHLLLSVNRLRRSWGRREAAGPTRWVRHVRGAAIDQWAALNAARTVAGMRARSATSWPLLRAQRRTRRADGADALPTALWPGRTWR